MLSGDMLIESKKALSGDILIESKKVLIGTRAAKQVGDNRLLAAFCVAGWRCVAHQFLMRREIKG